MNRLPLFLIIVFCFLLFSCKDEYTICNQARNVSFLASFYQKVGVTEVPANAPNLRVSLLSNNTSIYNGQSNVSSFNLNLDPLKDTSKYIISLGNTLPADTISIIYSTQSLFLSNDCGEVFTNNVTKILTTINTIDSVKITAPVVNTSLKVNAKIYF